MRAEFWFESLTIGESVAPAVVNKRGDTYTLPGGRTIPLDLGNMLSADGQSPDIDWELLNSKGVEWFGAPFRFNDACFAPLFAKCAA